MEEVGEENEGELERKGGGGGERAISLSVFQILLGL